MGTRSVLQVVALSFCAADLRRRIFEKRHIVGRKQEALGIFVLMKLSALFFASEEVEEKSSP